MLIRLVSIDTDLDIDHESIITSKGERQVWKVYIKFIFAYKNLSQIVELIRCILHTCLPARNQKRSYQLGWPLPLEEPL